MAALSALLGVLLPASSSTCCPQAGTTRSTARPPTLDAA